ncbi:pre-mRNA processing RNA-helicase [Tieghemiomyces parasiticus]|uniref:RNA helicase n=1 Tax=Tieghemiomyces parasiticus TaxID=78921 RepID=A0A9W7ZIS8_9FUNG|nr:pre-mRNA processing RNA-helicase [Tieghemiomyces parasiticus]
MSTEPSAPPASTMSQEEKQRIRRERLERWRRERSAAATPAAEEKPTPPGPTPPVPTAASSTAQPAPAPGPATLTPLRKPTSFHLTASGGRVALRRGNRPGSRPLTAFGAGAADDADEPQKKRTRLIPLPPLSNMTAGEDGENIIETNPVPGDPTEDSLDAFMADVNQEVQQITSKSRPSPSSPPAGTSLAETSASTLAEAAALDSDGESDTNATTDPNADLIALAARRAKKKELVVVDHRQMAYAPFQKDFFIEPAELRSLDPSEVDALRVQLDGIKIRGVDCPKPVRKWTQMGLPARCTEIIKKLEFSSPTPIQAQAIPAVLAGRDVIGVAKTGSGKTLAFILPMFRHIKAQRPLEPGEGPIALLMTPTRELAVQIHRECRWFAKALGLRALCAYGGSPIKENIVEVKRGAEVIVCTPGRLIDLMCANSGRLLSLSRVTYLVLDEADRMFDMGFEPQVMRIVNNIRPDRQTVLFSATFPRQMEALARKVLRRPLEITVGGRSVVCADVVQHVEVVPDERAKTFRLLEILGHTLGDDAPDARCLIFVDRQEAADQLLRELLRRGYPCMSLHGGKDQADRDGAVSDFKTGVTRILVATSVAARGLDVKNLNLVINYDCPNHLEDYVHRVGRTGRAGRRGDAYTFLLPTQDRYAVDVVKALRQSDAPVPEAVQALAEGFRQKVATGEAHFSGSGFGGKGLEQLEKDRDLAQQRQRQAYGQVDDEETGTTATTAETSEAPPPARPARTEPQEVISDAVRAAQEAAARVEATLKNGSEGRTQNILAAINAQLGRGTASEPDGDVSTTTTNAPLYTAEIEINDFPNKARWRVTSKGQIDQLTELTGASLTTRGTYYPPGKQPTGPHDERKLHLFIEGQTQLAVDQTQAEIRRILADATRQAMEAEAQNGPGEAVGRYSVL